eukprot:2583452-Prymnesium_polylepis.1
MQHGAAAAQHRRRGALADLVDGQRQEREGGARRRRQHERGASGRDDAEGRRLRALTHPPPR